MKAFFSDIKLGDFIASEHGLYPVSFDSSSTEDADVAMGAESDEEYIGRNSIPLDYGSKYQGKLSFEIGFVKKVCNSTDNEIFTPHEIREILRKITGYQYYRDMYFMDDEDIMRDDENIHYRVKCTNVGLRKAGGNIIGLNITFTCDSFWGYLDDQTVVMNITAGNQFSFYNNSDELYDYLCPVVELSNCTGDIEIKNISDNNRITKIKDLKNSEVVTLDAVHELITSTNHNTTDSAGNTKTLVDDFNLNWIKFLSGKNNLIADKDCKLKITYQLLRKVVF